MVDISNPSKRPVITGYRVGRIVSLSFFWDNHLSVDVPRSPFSTSRNWLAAILATKNYDCDRTAQEQLAGGSDEDDEDNDNEVTRVLIEWLTQILPKLFPSTDDDLQGFALRHDDIHEQNILVDAAGQLTALLNWECVSCVPLWKFCQMPHLIEGQG